MEAPLDTRIKARGLRRTMTLPEVLIWKRIKGRRDDGLHFRKQHPFGPYVLDFFCDEAKLAIEVDGQGHGAGDRPQRDARRDAWLADQGVRTLRISARFVLESPDDAVRMIVDEALGGG